MLDFRFRGDVRDGVHAATWDGSAVELTFRGSAVTWTGPLAPDQGTVGVYLDGRLVERVDTRCGGRSRSCSPRPGSAPGSTPCEVSGEIMRVDAVGYVVR